MMLRCGSHSDSASPSAMRVLLAGEVDAARAAYDAAHEPETVSPQR